MSFSSTLPIYIGYEEREHRAYEVCKFSIEQRTPTDIEIIKLASELVQVKSEIFFSRNEFNIGTGNWKNTSILKDEIKIKANIFLFKE